MYYNTDYWTCSTHSRLGLFLFFLSLLDTLQNSKKLRMKVLKKHFSCHVSLEYCILSLLLFMLLGFGKYINIIYIIYISPPFYYRYGAVLIGNCELRPGHVVTVSNNQNIAIIRK